MDIVVHDIVATFCMTATVNNAGEALGGAFSLTGKSLTLGVSTPETLLSGNILEVGPPAGRGAAETKVAAIDPDLLSVVGSPGYAVLDFVSLRDKFGFSGLTATEALVVYLVPEPATGFLVLGGLALIWVLRSRRC